MPINYHCDLATDVSADEIVSHVQALIGGTVEKEPDGQIYVVTAGLVAQVNAIDDAQDRAWALKDWGLDSRITVSFDLVRSAPDEEYSAARRAFSIASVKLAEDLDTDAILLFEMDRVMMRRKDGVLTLYDWWPEWRVPEVIAALPSGYTLTRDGEEAPHNSSSP